MKYLQFYSLILEKDSTFKFDSTTKIIAYTLDKLSDIRFEKQAD
jgi:hypothetical protein